MDAPNGMTPAMLAGQSAQNELVRRKIEMDALRKRLGDNTSKEEKLRESCEGFEAIFLQKMWEQMRKTVPKEGYLHSKDEEMYQSLFDIELCKKMAGAGGIGLADMLYEQLSQQLADSGRTTSPGAYRIPLEIAPAGLAAATKQTQPPQPEPAALPDARLTAESLYSPLPADTGQDQEQEAGRAQKADGPSLDDALHELRADLGKAPPEAGQAARAWAEARARATGTYARDTDPADAKPAVNATNGPARPEAVAENTRKAAQADHGVANASAPLSPARTGGPPDDTAATASKAASGPAGSSRTGSGPATPVDNADKAAEARRLFGRARKTTAAKSARSAEAAPQARGMVPEGTMWPLGGDGGEIVSHFGWEDIKGGGKRRWNSGIRITAPPQSPVRAVLGGTVVYAGEREGFGHTVVMEHQNGFRSYYGNLAEAKVRVGDKLTHGAEFAKLAVPAPSSSQGEKTASLYFELKKGEMALNPENAIGRPKGGTTMSEARSDV